MVGVSSFCRWSKRRYGYNIIKEEKEIMQIHTKFLLEVLFSVILFFCMTFLGVLYLIFKEEIFSILFIIYGVLFTISAGNIAIRWIPIGLVGT